MPLIELLQTSLAVFYPAIALLGLIVGSFLNVVIARLPLMLEENWRRDCRELLAAASEERGQDSEPVPDLLRPASHCPACRHPVRLRHNIPLLGYLMLGGKCAHCHAAIGVRYPLVEALACLLSLSAAIVFGPQAQLLPACLFGWVLIALLFIDQERRLLPDALTLPLLWGGLLCNCFGLFADLHSAVGGCVFGYLILWTVCHLFRLLTGKHGLGHGDFKLLAAIGAWLGWQALPLVILLSSFGGAVVGIVLIALGRRRRDEPLPFGPYLAVAGWAGLVGGAA